LRAWHASMVADAGGQDALSTAHAELAGVLVAKKAAFDKLTPDVLGMTSLVNKRNRCLYPVVLQWFTLADSLERGLERFGFSKKAAQRMTLEDYVREKAREKAAQAARETEAASTPSKTTNAPQNAISAGTEAIDATAATPKGHNEQENG